jgi:uncharacterized protein (TIGR01619 family)
MTENWRSYFCNVNDSLASIFVNLGLRNDVPILSKPWLLWVWVYFRSHRPDGLSDGNEAPEIFRIEDAITLELSRSCGTILSGRVTTEGRRELYFYGETRTGFSKVVAKEMSDFEGYKFDIGEQEDALWEQYLNVLYPSAEDLERIKNRDLLDVLEQKGDVLTAARDVEHWMYFASEASRASFRKAAVEAGFRIASESQLESRLQFGISVVRTQAVEQALIDATVIELLHLTRQFQGEYDGWETPLITQ